MPTKEQFAVNMQRHFKRHNQAEMPDVWLSWAYHAFRMGYTKGQDDFMKSHDWYE